MIRRKPSKANMSLVNMSQEEHLTVSGGIVTSTPVTNLQTVKNSENFELDNDGSYILRKPLILKEKIFSKDTYYLYDKETRISYRNGKFSISSGTLMLKFYDVHVEQKIVEYLSTYDFISEFINIYNALDHTLVSVKLNHETFKTQVTIGGTAQKLVHDSTGYNPNLYRFLKIYKDTDLGENVWVIEIVHPEFNSITSTLDSNAQQFDVNMLLDNPYAIRDLYNYGYNSATKILTYVPLPGANGYSNETEINNLPIYKLTEENAIGNKGFRIMTANNNSYKGTVILKAFVTTLDNTSPTVKYYCCWERSTNGITWEACPEFLNKFSSSDYEERKVIDLTSAELDKLIFEDSLTEAVSYLVTKKLVSFETISDEEDLIGERPDVLVFFNLNDTFIKYQYRFQVYMDTGIETPKTILTKTAGSNYFSRLPTDGSFTPLDFQEVFRYKASKNSGTAYGGNSADPELDNGVIVLHPGDSNNTVGNSILINFSDSTNKKVKQIKITIGSSLKTTETVGGTSVNTYKDATSVLGYALNQKPTVPELGTYGGSVLGKAAPNEQYPNSTVDEYFEDHDSVVHAKTSDALEGFLQDKSFNSNGYENLILLETAEASDGDKTDAYNARQPLLNATPVGYTEVEGFFFEISEACTFAGFNLAEGDIITATSTGWKLTQNVHYSQGGPTPTVTLVNTTAEQVVEIGLEEVSELFSTTGIELYCVSNFTYSEDVGKHNLRIAGIQIVYEEQQSLDFNTNTYLESSVATVRTEYGKDMEYAIDLTKQRENIFRSEIFFDNASYKFFAKDNVYYSGIDSMIIRALNVLHFSNTVTKILPYRNYLLVFTTKDISSVALLEDGSYSVKVISSTVGLSKADANTAIVILNSIYFKSGVKVYKLVPNLYAYKDDVLNIHPISTPIDDLFTHIVDTTFETTNFGYSDVNTYRVFIPSGNSLTYCFIYNLEKKAWTLVKYPVALHRLEINTLNEAYVVKDMTDIDAIGGGIYHFKDDLNVLLEQIRLQEFVKIQGTNVNDSTDKITAIKAKYVDDYGEEIVRPVVYGTSVYTFIDAGLVYSKIPYGDYLQKSLEQLYDFVNSEALSIIGASSTVDYTTLKVEPISFKIDFGQKSSNYMLDKQFLESKMIFATLHPKDMFPVTVDIATDGNPKPLHWDCNTDSPFWKNEFNDIGTLNTEFQDENAEYNGILRQLIIKYSGKGKTARHLITGKSKYRFKFISMNTRFRVLPNKQ